MLVMSENQRDMFGHVTAQRIERELAHARRMREHEERMKAIAFALAYSRSVEAFPLTIFGEVIFVNMN